MRPRHSMEKIERAELFYCVNGLSVGAIGVQLGVPERTVRSWTRKYGWREKRERVRNAFSTIRIDSILLRARLLEKCMESLDPQDAYAMVALESEAKKWGPAAAGYIDPAPECLREIGSEKDVVGALNEAIKIKLNRTLADPARLNFPEMRDLKKVVELVREMESRLPRRPAVHRGLSTETVSAMRRILEGREE